MVGSIADQFICQCGCTKVLSACDCGTAAGMVAVISEKLAQGESEEQITQYFVAQYGEQVLASPPKKGFNLVVWILPFAAILTGGGVVYIVLKKWVWQGRQPPSISGAEEENEDEEYQEQLEKELEEFSEVGFR
jgi:cytochrome c-type biogenesis protein CcmH